ncbi:hypothetical protein K435DRAFT_734054 [Dendrothele bispora CBS 962.96]|uniref:Uncharacterized protein n=1 Tax=Dendrothele bispora (strain CBS 962.96) TaxID=1314807 RepID=A0A4S8L450_DENBC|nr:hypothetical protein K435DRAFT_734054 [Dendrothele bispora CBS 962.96]
MLYPSGYGYPLWIPEPNESTPLRYRSEGIQVGDVGFITSYGNFEFLFNTTWPKDHPVHQEWRKLPDDFHPIKLDPTYYSRHANGISRNQWICSKDTKVYGKEEYSIARNSNKEHPHVGFYLSSKLGEAAALFLPRGASKTDYVAADLLCNWAKEHAKEWYHHIQNEHYTDAWNGSLYLITGFLKTDCYDVSVSSGLSNKTIAHSPSEHRYSECHASGSQQNCAVFIRGWKIMLKSSRSVNDPLTKIRNQVTMNLAEEQRNLSSTTEVEVVNIPGEKNFSNVSNTRRPRLDSPYLEFEMKTGAGLVGDL